MKKLTIAIALLLANTAGANSETWPKVLVDSVEHYLVVKDVSSGKSYGSADGYCVVKGFQYSMVTVSVLVSTGPYAIMDAHGKVIETYPSEGNANRFKVLYQAQCSD